MAVRNSFRQPSEQLAKLGTAIEDTMKCALNVAEDVQSEDVLEDGSHNYVEDIKQYLVEFAKLAEDVSLRKKALDQLKANSDVPEDQEPLDLSSEFTSCLETLKNSQNSSYDPWSHPILEEFKDQILEGPENGEDEHVSEGGLEDSEVVVGQVTKSLKCPITRQFYEQPVTSKSCHHSYSHEAIKEHIKRSRGPNAKCPVCGLPLKLSDLERDKKLEAKVKKAKRQKRVDQDRDTSVVNL